MAPPLSINADIPDAYPTASADRPLTLGERAASNFLVSVDKTPATASQRGAELTQRLAELDLPADQVADLATQKRVAKDKAEFLQHIIDDVLGTASSETEAGRPGRLSQVADELDVAKDPRGIASAIASWQEWTNVAMSPAIDQAISQLLAADPDAAKTLMQALKQGRQAVAAQAAQLTGKLCNGLAKELDGAAFEDLSLANRNDLKSACALLAENPGDPGTIRLFREVLARAKPDLQHELAAAKNDESLWSSIAKALLWVGAICILVATVLFLTVASGGSVLGLSAVAAGSLKVIGGGLALGGVGNILTALALDKWVAGRAVDQRKALEDLLNALDKQAARSHLFHQDELDREERAPRAPEVAPSPTAPSHAVQAPSNPAAGGVGLKGPGVVA